MGNEEKPSISISFEPKWDLSPEVIPEPVKKPEKKQPVLEKEETIFYSKHPRAKRIGIPDAALIAIFDKMSTHKYVTPAQVGATSAQMEELVRLGRIVRKD